jgi:L-ascorbate metabolism protein UlaG (beta-lactamase superfamily)
MKITWLGHAAFRLETAKATILIDPFFTGNPSFEGNDRKDAVKGVTHILLTHGHGDHVGDTAAIAKETGAVVCQLRSGMWLGHHHGLDKLEAGNTGGTISLDGFSATFVNALHSSAQITEDGVSHSLGSANGLMLHFEDEPSLLHMGDTDIFSDMALINELHRPEIGIVPIGDRFTMGGAVAALACRRFFSFAKVLPCHYGTFPIIDQTADAFVEAMEGRRDNVAVPKSGESVDCLSRPAARQPDKTQCPAVARPGRSRL